MRNEFVCETGIFGQGSILLGNLRELCFQLYSITDAQKDEYRYTHE